MLLSTFILAGDRYAINTSYLSAKMTLSGKNAKQ